MIRSVFPGVLVVKNLPAMQETQVLPLGQEDPLEKGKWQPTPVFLPGESGQRSLVSYSPLGHSPDRTEANEQQQQQQLVCITTVGQSTCLLKKGQ